MKTIITILVTNVTLLDFFLGNTTDERYPPVPENKQRADAAADCTEAALANPGSAVMHIASAHRIKSAVHDFVCGVTQYVPWQPLAHGAHVQLPELWCHWCSLLSSSVLTGCVMRCAGPVLQPGPAGGGSSTVGYSRAGYRGAVM